MPLPHPDPRARDITHRRALTVLGAATALRLLTAALLPLGVDESYEAVIARTLSASYFDHPPAVFWITHAAAAIGGESPFVLRLPFVLLFVATSWLLYRLGARLFGERAGLWTLAVAQVMPVFGFSSGGWVLPDGPLLCATAAAALAFAHAVPVSAGNGREPARHGPWTAWLALGIALGAAGLSKYHAALLGAGLLAFVATDARARRWLRHPAPYVAIGIALACVIPVFTWNAQHDWISFRFQSGRAAGRTTPVVSLLQNLAGQAGYLMPWFWVPTIAVLAKALRAGPASRTTWLCVCLGFPPVLVFTLAALGGHPGLPHWPAPGYLLLLPLLGAAIARWEERAPALARRWMMRAAAVYVTLVTIVVSHAATGWVASLVPSLHRRDPAFELLTYRALKDSLERDGTLQRASYVAVTDWIRGSKVGYALGPAHPIVLLNQDTRHFRFAGGLDTLPGRRGLMLMAVPKGFSTVEMWDRAYPLVSMFDTLRFVRMLPVLRGRDTAVTMAVFETSNLRRTWPVPPAR
ncbi:MAG: glycosyltransferase family 39 protein [Gemmatimonadaceae bacterium]|nr:glycosyltransferase family 39 protein [Gemmatimonadaceae bacterium]